MQGIKYGIWLFMLFALTACGSSDGDSASRNAPASSVELQEGVTRTAYISTEGEVDTYRLRANEVNRYLNIRCTETTSGSNVDLLVTVFQEVNGNRTRIFGKHKPDGATLSADLDLWIYVDAPKDIVIEVRDLMGNDMNDEIPYNLTYTYQDSNNGNHDFSNAQSITIGPDGALQDVIDDAGQVDCFTFAPQTDGVYALSVDHQKIGDTSPVQLAVSLYDVNGNRITRVIDPNDTILAYLEEANGPYNVSVEDSDSADADASAPYDISVVAVTVDESQANDTYDNPTAITADAGGVYTATGAIDYGASSTTPGQGGDVDWYSLTVGSVGGSTTYHPLQLNIDNGANINGTSTLRVTVYDSEMDPVTYYEFKGGDDAYQNQIRVENGAYFISVEAASGSSLDQGTTYQVQLSEVTINDPGEVGDDNTANSAKATPATGYVSYLSDVDWYGVDVNTTTAKILSVDLTSDQSIIDYQVSIWRGDQMVKRVTDMDGSDGPTHLKTSVLVPAEVPATDATYHIRVADAQNNEGSDISYSVTTNVATIPGAPGHIAQTSGSTLHYYDEINVDDEIIYNDEFEITEQNERVRLEIFSTDRPFFKYNSDWLDFRTHTEYRSTPGDGSTVITFPWVSGYVDFQDDRDFLRLDFDKLDPAGTETSWYYDVEIELVAAASDVEYVWKLYRDRNSNGIVMDNPTSPDGYIACAGDVTPEALDAIDLVTPTGDETFWIGSEMGAGAKFFIGISDFNFLKLPETGSGGELDDNPQPDEDWGYNAPYYFRLKLTYHPGQATPN